METDYFGLLYRERSTFGGSIRYLFHLNHVLTADEEDALKINFIERYDNLSVEQVNKITKTVRAHQDSQKTLIEKIEGILNK